ncbi:uncharacterized protein BP5553_02967 [Venustampulla echinocandica]|uniref:P-loop containing nucleoside triphosphate hydrolase n=1 Tax=Venustampulla echinocandica TaxID=2656787 RepID=A0A370TSX7_9HELO|nr:uncharacterized protein BP5553_02967 [Venustampulla echinocandica]RDL38627.1 hypothetical protein BP5553_02967 [Venustampulla echinocandica]
MKVIVAGLPRTATTSIKAALEHLGYGPCYHHIEPLNQYDRIKLSSEIIACKDKIQRQKMLQKLFHGFEVALEHPAGPCLDDLLEIYPDAKVILSTRKNASVWLESFLGMGPDLRSPLFRFTTYWLPGVWTTSNLHEAWLRQCNERWGIPKPCTELYHAHNGWVRTIVPEDRLLEFQPAMGWNPLCKFLKKDRSSITGPFPRLNPRQYLKGLKDMAQIVGGLIWFALFVVLAILMGLSFNVPFDARKALGYVSETKVL